MAVPDLPEITAGLNDKKAPSGHQKGYSVAWISNKLHEKAVVFSWISNPPPGIKNVSFSVAFQ